MRLIDATMIEQFILNNCSDSEEINEIYGELINAPTIDLVRCGECMHKIQALSTEQGATSCELIRGTFYEDFFCKCGDRRADEHTN